MLKLWPLVQPQFHIHIYQHLASNNDRIEIFSGYRARIDSKKLESNVMKFAS